MREILNKKIYEIDPPTKVPNEDRDWKAFQKYCEDEERREK